MTQRPGNNLNRKAARRHLIKCSFGLLCALTAPLAMAQERLLVEGILDAEVYQTDASSKRLSRNDGDTSTLFRLQLWAAYQLNSNLQIYTLGEFETDNASEESETNTELDQLSLRYSNNSNPYYYIEAGKLLSPIGAAAMHHLSTLNALIGKPHTHDTSYPWGARLAGSFDWFDYHLAVLDKPVINNDYAPEPGSAFRPAVNVGTTLFTGLRVGASYTEGPYLNSQLDEFLPPGADWRDFDQRVLGFDVQFSRGFLQIYGGLEFSEYDVPFHPLGTDNTDYYIDLKYTWSPRFYSALRYEKNDSSVIKHLGRFIWKVQDINVYDVEIGLGYRFSADTLLKLAYRYDHWSTMDGQESVYPNGHSLALQLSHQFDLKSWFVKKPR